MKEEGAGRFVGKFSGCQFSMAVAGCSKLVGRVQGGCFVNLLASQICHQTSQHGPCSLLGPEGTNKLEDGVTKGVAQQVWYLASNILHCSCVIVNVAIHPEAAKFAQTPTGKLWWPSRKFTVGSHQIGACAGYSQSGAAGVAACFMMSSTLTLHTTKTNPHKRKHVCCQHGDMHTPNTVKSLSRVGPPSR